MESFDQGLGIVLMERDALFCSEVIRDDGESTRGVNVGIHCKTELVQACFELERVFKVRILGFSNQQQLIRHSFPEAMGETANV